MITVLATNAYKAAYKAVKASTPAKSIPVSSHILIYVNSDNRLTFVPFRFDERAEHTETIPARVDGVDFAACVPAKPFRDWLHATQEKQPKRGIGRGDCNQIQLTFDPECQRLHIKAGNTRAEFCCIDAREFPPC